MGWISMATVVRSCDRIFSLRSASQRRNPRKVTYVKETISRGSHTSVYALGRFASAEDNATQEPGAGRRHCGVSVDRRYDCGARRPVLGLLEADARHHRKLHQGNLEATCQ